MGDGQPFVIDKLGGQGDGVASGSNGPLFVPFALPGETWCLEANGYRRLSDAEQRADPPCGHFGHCGGCVAQHMDSATYASWKTSLVTSAFGNQNLDVTLRPLWQVPAGSRRRVVWSAVGDSRHIALGFRAAGSHKLVEITECAIADPKIVASIPAIRSLLTLIAGTQPLPDETRINVLLADNGVDVAIQGVGQTSLAAAQREQLADVAQRDGIVRLSILGEEVYQCAQPILRVANVDIPVPAGVFVQAVGAAEAKMVELVLEAVGRARHVADLFCGIGAFSLPIARRSRVFAVDSHSHAVSALDQAVRHAQGLKPVESLRRDLFREPLSRNELKTFDVVVFDPPRAGAAAQSAALAKSRVPTVVAVSCNPATMARDLRTLIDGGYHIESVTPIDQFLYSAHVEVVAVLRR